MTHTSSKKELLDFFTEGAPSYAMANEAVKSHARQKVAEITPILTQALKEIEQVVLSSMADGRYDVIAAIDNKIKELEGL